MEKRRAIDMKSPFPNHIQSINHVQSFLTGRQAAQTSILSKFWYNAWLTRPHLDFDQRDFWHSDRPRSIDFIEIMKKTLQRYEESNLRIQSFRLWMLSGGPVNYSLIAELVVKAIRLGAINLDLDFYFSGKFMKGVFMLPCEVLESETLTSLSLCNCNISLDADRNLSCRRLKSLTLRNVCLGGNIICDILSGGSLLEDLVVYDCTSVDELGTSDAVGMLSLCPSVNPSVNPYEFQRIKWLWLEKVHINTLFFSDFSSKFPCLKDLRVSYCSGFEQIFVSSHTLEFISLKLSEGMLRASFDVPRVHKFCFVGSSCLFPSLTFKRVSQDLKCSITVSYNKHSTSWFYDLKKFIRNLNLSSRIHLYINSLAELCENSCDYACDDYLPIPVLEHLSIESTSLVPSAFVYGLFQSCQAKLLTLDLLNCCTTWKAHCDYVKLLCEIRRFPDPSIGIGSQCDLKKVIVKSFKNGKWQSLPWKILLDASIIPSDIEKLRFQLRWDD